MQKKEIIIEGIKISYVQNFIQDDLPICVLLHGWGAKASVFQNIFPKNQSYLAIDFPGFGDSAPLHTPYTLEDFARITSMWMQKIIPSSKKIILIGHSFGGRVICKMLHENIPLPSVDKIIMIGVPFYRTITRTQQLISKASAVFSWLPWIKPAVKKIFYTFWKDSDYELLEENAVMKRTFQNIITEEIDGYIPSLEKHPLYLLWGEDDRVTPLSYAQKVHQQIVASSLLTFPSAGHCPFLDTPQQFSEVFFKTLQK